MKIIGIVSLILLGSVVLGVIGMTLNIITIPFGTSAGIRKDWTFEDRTGYARLNEVERGLKSQSK